jgi:hypothetical protein
MSIERAWRWHNRVRCLQVFSPRLVDERGWPIFRPRVNIGLSAMMGLDRWLVNKLDNRQAAKLNFGALQVSFPCPHFEVGSNPKGIVSPENLADSALGWAFGALPACQPATRRCKQRLYLGVLR